jgi:gluconolactonase
MQGEIIAEDLAFPEGPVWDGWSLVFTEIIGGRLSRWTEGEGVTMFAETGGGPNGAVLADDGSYFVTQNGGMPPGPRAQAGIQRVSADGEVTMLTTEVGGLALEGPNDLTFGPDGRLYFTDPRGAADQTNDRPGRLFAISPETGEGELLIELDPVFPNGIGFLDEGTLLWTESFSRRINALVDGQAELVIQLPDNHYPDGFCVGRDGRLYVASTYAHCISVIEDGEIVDRLMVGDGMATNCCFGGSDLYVTESRHGTLWRFELGT